MDGILDVDLLRFEHGTRTQRAAVVNGTMTSLMAGGFVYTAHDLSSDMLDETYGMLEAFFALDKETKDGYADPCSTGGRGYTGTLVETAAVSDTPDWKEMFNWSAAVPDGHPLAAAYPRWYRPPLFPENNTALPANFAETMLEFHNRTVELQRRFLRVVATGIGLHENFFDRMTDTAPHLSRAIHYPPMQAAPDDGEAYIWADEHGDINLITMLPRATARGLQIRLQDGAWIDAEPPDDHVIVNTGIMLEHLTNGVIPVGWHRVIAAPGQAEDRISVVQFCHPRPTTVLTPVPPTVTAANLCRYESVSAADLLAEVLWQINLADN